MKLFLIYFTLFVDFFWVIWRKSVEANLFSLSWSGNCGGVQCSVLDVDTVNNITEITIQGTVTPTTSPSAKYT